MSIPFGSKSNPPVPPFATEPSWLEYNGMFIVIGIVTVMMGVAMWINVKEAW